MNKYDFGHVLIAAGSLRMLGAACLSAHAALRTGAGLVTLGVPESVALAAQKKVPPEVMVMPLPETAEHTISRRAWPRIKPLLKKKSCLAVGPGLGRHPSTMSFVKTVVREIHVPLVLDADGINALIGSAEVLAVNTAPKILTPHPGEFQRVIGRAVPEGLRERVRLAVSFAAAHHCVLLLKGHKTVVANPDGRYYINQTGHPALAAAGSGDVLTGMIAALVAQTNDVFQAGCWGAYLHGLCARRLIRRIPAACLIASDLVTVLPDVLKTVLRRRPTLTIVRHTKRA